MRAAAARRVAASAIGHRITISRSIDAPSDRAWDVLTRVDGWHRWGSSIRSARLDDDGERISAGSTGVVTTFVGINLPFTVTDFVDGVSWRWRVAGIPATGHGVRTVDCDRCEVWFDVPLPAIAYLPVCRAALGSIDRLLRTDG